MVESQSIAILEWSSMPITPPPVTGLLEAYDDLLAGATSLTGAAAAIAPAAVRDVICQAGGLLSLLGGPLGPFQGPGSRDGQLSDWGGVLQAACPVPPPLPSAPPPPFQGGQCEELYLVSWFRNGTFNGNPNNSSGTTNPLLGPIAGISTVFPSNGGIQGILSYNGGTIQVGSAGGPPNAWSQDSTITITNVQRVDGLPDDCGDPPSPPAPPPGPIPTLPDSPTIPDGGPGGGGGFIFRPTVGPITVGPDGGINIPVVVNVGGPSLNIPITIPVNVSLPDFAPTINIGGGGGVSPPGGGGPTIVIPPTPPPPICCRPPVLPGEEIEGEEDEPVVGPPPEPRRRLIGLLVRSSVNPAVASITEIAQGGGSQNLWVPRLGNAYFTVTARTAQNAPVAAPTQDSPVKLLVQFVAAPQGVTATSFRVVPEPGVQMSVQPLYVADN